MKTVRRSPNSITLRMLATIDTSTFKFVEVVVSDADGMDVPKTLIVVNDEQAGTANFKMVLSRWNMQILMAMATLCLRFHPWITWIMSDRSLNLMR